MFPRQDRLATRLGRNSHWADAHRLRHDDAGKSFDEIDSDHSLISGAYRARLATGLSFVPSVAHQSPASTADTRALPTAVAIGPGGEPYPHADPVTVINPEARLVRRRLTTEAVGWSVAIPDMACGQSRSRLTTRGTL